jgi:hypothetical protein
VLWLTVFGARRYGGKEVGRCFLHHLLRHIVDLLKTKREIAQQESMHIEPIFILENLKWENQHPHRYLLTLAKPANTGHLRLLTMDISSH